MWRPDFLIKKKERRCDGSISPTEVAGLVEEKEPRIVPVPECMQLALFGARHELARLARSQGMGLVINLALT
jgi:hypothetical protein